jgi:EAL domain-containing protein (putative c-di-GMP-specific phosphodiesterase class I)
VKAEAKQADPVTYLRQALAEDAFAVFCQPICAIGEPLTYPMAEALVRLREEEAALCPPGEFLPVLEHYGLMPELDRWVTRQVLKHLADGAHHPRFCVNLSAQTLADRGYPAYLANELSASGVPGEALLLEIDELDALAQPELTARFAAVTGSLGCGLVIDGLGRSADFVEPLKFPNLTHVKLCSSLTRMLIAAAPLEEELRALLQVTAGMGIKVVAECVEEPAALVALRQRGVGFAQGFGVYRPHPLEACVEAQQPA